MFGTNKAEWTLNAQNIVIRPSTLCAHTFWMDVLFSKHSKHCKNFIQKKRRIVWLSLIINEILRERKYNRIEVIWFCIVIFTYCQRFECVIRFWFDLCSLNVGFCMHEKYSENGIYWTKRKLMYLLVFAAIVVIVFFFNFPISLTFDEFISDLNASLFHLPPLPMHILFHCIAP